MTTTISINQSIMDRFFKFVEQGRLAHAYLFIGPQGVGKFETALQVAKLLNCENFSKESGNDPCEMCSSCRRIDVGNHPDVHILSCPPEETVKIEDIRDLIVQVQLKPFESQRKIFIIRDSETLTLEAGNALLKTLEEPSPMSLIILTTAVPERNLGTIRSRCQPIYFFPTSRGRLADYLQNDYHITKETAAFLAAYSEGCLGRARHLQEGDFLKRKNEIIEQMIFAPANEAYLKKITADRELAREVLMVLWSWFRDALLMQQGLSEAQVIHVDRTRELKKMALTFGHEELDAILRQIIKATQLLNDNLNVKIALILLKEKICTGLPNHEWRETSTIVISSKPKNEENCYG